MGRKKPSLCFIDDDPNELARFKKAVADTFVVGVGTSVSDALNDLRAQGRKGPNLYILDMYFPSGGLNTPDELARLGAAWDKFRAAEADLKRILEELNQSFAGGRALANQISSRGLLGKTPFVFFTRKGTLLNAIEAYEQSGAISVIKKPDPRQPIDEAKRTQAYDAAMIENRDVLIRAIEAAIHRASFWYRYKAPLLAFLIGIVSSAVAWFLTTQL